MIMDEYEEIKKLSEDEYCPHCGYYCTGKTVFCTKHPDSPQMRREKNG